MGQGTIWSLLHHALMVGGCCILYRVFQKMRARKTSDKYGAVWKTINLNKNFLVYISSCHVVDLSVAKNRDDFHQLVLKI